MLNDPVLHIHSLQSKYLGDGLSDGLGSEILKQLSLRSILIAHPHDEVIVSKSPDEDWIQYLLSTGLELPKFTVTQGTGETLVEQITSDPYLMSSLKSKADPILPYMGGDQIELLSANLGRVMLAPESSILDRLNLKSNLNPILKGLDIPTIHTEVVDRDHLIEFAQQSLEQLGPLIIRSDLSIGGHGVWKIESASDLEGLSEGVRNATAKRLFIVQPLLNVTNSPNVQFFMTDAGYECLGMSAQQMTPSFAFGGNNFPSPMSQNTAINEQSNTLAKRLYESGYRGMIGIDFIVTDDGQVYIVEINPRVNTSTFPLLLTDRIGAKAFRLMTGLRVPSASFMELIESIGSDLLYSSGTEVPTGSGMIPLMVPSNTRGILDAMIFADDPNEIDRISDELQHRIESVKAEDQRIDRVGVLGDH